MSSTTPHTHATGWPLYWHPDHFDVEETNAAPAIAVAEPVAVTGELAEIAEQFEHRGVRLLREVLGRPLSRTSPNAAASPTGGSARPTART